MKYLLGLILFISPFVYGQQADTLNGYDKKIEGEEISYFSHLHQFASVALLTRMNGSMPISWSSPLYTGNNELVTYEFILGHSTGTSKAERHFDCTLNGELLFTIATPYHQQGGYRLQGNGNNGSSYLFILEEYDVNGDAFGKFFITVPAKMVSKQAAFTIKGKNEDSRDWLMIFQYHRGLKLLIQPTNLVTRREGLRQLNVFVDYPHAGTSSIRFTTGQRTLIGRLKQGYNKLQFPAFDTTVAGKLTIDFIVNMTDTLTQTFSLAPLKNYVFCIIHHSHNDIGYSHLQPEVERIQNNNIRAALRWVQKQINGPVQPVWHIESLWAVENFLKTASAAEENEFVQAVKNGNIVLSANYANILTGLCQPEEQGWVTEYARKLEAAYGFTISNAMITDIPGITRSGLQAFVTHHIPYLSLGPNYVQNMPDHGDRVGGVINEQGDKIFYWKPFPYSNDRLLVWTAGKGYSYFHGITDSEKQVAWEKRISEYCNELNEKNYPYELVQLRYTKNSDNGPVDTSLTAFVHHWNDTYSTPQLRISSVIGLFAEMEKRYGPQLPIETGEISPYWEDGAYSTAAEEMQARQLVLKTLALERFARTTDQLEQIKAGLYSLHKNIVLFHEHTWGAWCSVSDPENPFTTEQWRIKKQFLDSAVYYYAELSQQLHFRYNPVPFKDPKNLSITGYTVDPLHGGLTAITVNNKNMVSDTSSYKFFEPVYMLGINPMKQFKPVILKRQVIENSKLNLVTVVKGTLPSVDSFIITYRLAKNENRLYCHYRVYKKKETDKEALHIALPFRMKAPLISYRSGNDVLQYDRDQLPGSNKEFICVEKDVMVQGNGITATVSAPALALYEVGSIIDENRTNGAKVWKSTNPTPSSLFLYVLNNYWHTNYKAYQEGILDFEIELHFQKAPPVQKAGQ